MNQQEYDLMYQMITDSGEMWRESRDRSQCDGEVVICTNPSRAWLTSRMGASLTGLSALSHA